MISVEELIVEGKCFVPMDDITQYQKMKNHIKEFMNNNAYISDDVDSFSIPNKFLTMSFFLKWTISSKIPLGIRIKKLLHLIHEEEVLKKQYYVGLYATRDDIPLKITFLINPSILKNQQGLYIKIRSEPVILYKMRQYGERPKLDEFTYSNIIDTNKQFINEIIFGTLGGFTIEEPKVIAEPIKSQFIDVLTNLGFDKIAQLIEKGNSKIERGDIEDGLTDLRSALEHFSQEMVSKINLTPQKNIPSNLDILKKYGYIDEHLHSIVQETIYDWIYRYISNTSVHKREKISVGDAKLLFSISELVMNYLIQKVIYRS